MTNILFICTANRDRSRTAEIYFQNEYQGYRFRSAGINKYSTEKHGGVHLKRYMLDNADRIICMERCHKQYIVDYFDKKYGDKIEVLNLGDTQNFMSMDLILKLVTKVTI